MNIEDCDLPDFIKFEQVTIGARDKVAQEFHVDPENVRCIGVRLYYLVSRKIANDRKESLIMTAHQKYDRNYADMLGLFDNRIASENDSNDCDNNYRDCNNR